MNCTSTEPIRVLCVFARLDRGGAETMCMNLYRNIDRSRVQFDFIKHTQEKGAYEDEIRELGGRIYTAPRFVGINYMSYKRWWKNHLQNHPEHNIIHGHFFTISAVYFRFSHRYGRVTIGHSHSSDQGERDLKTWIKKNLQKLIERESDYCLACSSSSGKWLFPNREFYVLKNAIDLNRFCYRPLVRQSVRMQFGIGDELVVGTVCNFTYPKNPSGLIDIFREVLKENPHAKLIWVGNGPLKKEAVQTVRGYNLEHQVIFTGVRSDVDELMQAMDVFLLPSFYEGLPVVTVEAQATGLPCLLSDSLTRETAITDHCKFLPLRALEKWAKEIHLINPSQRSDMRDQIIAAGYDIRTTAKWLENFYVNL